MAAFDRVTGKKTEPLAPDHLAALVAGHRGVVLDIGTGDGRFVLDGARVEPDRLWIGLDAVAGAMAESARMAAAKPNKGGRPNALFLRGAAESLPGPLAAVADRLTVNYPWGSLLRIVSRPEVAGLRRLAATVRPGAAISILLNHAVFEDPDYLDRIGLAGLQDVAVNDALPAGFAAAGFGPVTRALTGGDPGIRTRWTGQLVRGAKRRTLMITTTV